MKITKYEQSPWGTQNKMTQAELQEMAKKIVGSCKFVSEAHHSYNTNNPEQRKSDENFTCILDGSMSLTYKSDVIPVTYAIHFDCGIVIGIVEMLDY